MWDRTLIFPAGAPNPWGLAAVLNAGTGAGFEAVENGEGVDPHDGEDWGVKGAGAGAGEE